MIDRDIHGNAIFFESGPYATPNGDRYFLHRGWLSAPLSPMFYEGAPKFEAEVRFGFRFSEDYSGRGVFQGYVMNELFINKHYQPSQIDLKRHRPRLLYLYAPNGELVYSIPDSPDAPTPRAMAKGIRGLFLHPESERFKQPGMFEFPSGENKSFIFVAAK